MNKFKILNNSSPKLIGNKEKGLVFVLSAPAGTGKTTLSHMICEEFQGVIAETISCTTRTRRLSEEDGVHYHFISEEVFKQKIEADEFLEYAQVFDHYYGTLKSEIENKIASGAHVILVIDTQGAMRIKNLIEAIFIFLAPPSLEELEKRLILRQTDSPEMIKNGSVGQKKRLDLQNITIILL